MGYLKKNIKSICKTILKNNSKIISIQDWPKYNDSLTRILYPQKKLIKKKDKKEVLREFDIDKWGPVIGNYNSQTWPSATNFIQEEESKKKTTIFFDGDIFYSSMDIYIKLKSKLLYLIYDQLSPKSPIIELGSAYGYNLIYMHHMINSKNINLFGGEISPSAVKLSDVISSDFNLPIKSFKIDFSNLDKYIEYFPEKAVVITSASIFYLDAIPDSFFNSLKLKKPKYVFHLEPIYPPEPDIDIYSTLQRRYMEINGYSKTILSTLKQKEDLGLIKIIEITPPFIGTNILLRYSLIIWTFL